MRIIPFFVILSLAVTFAAYSQVRMGKLVIKPKQVYELKNSDIIVADTLIMMDSSVIHLNRLKKDNYLRVAVAFIGNGCIINGAGVDGSDGRIGRNGDTPFGPCKDGEGARNGGRGLNGGSGNNLYMYFEHLIFSGRLLVDLSGGKGGQGGDGGNGGGGSPGTVHCAGGDGGAGGNGGIGGDGGNAGQLTISCVRCPDVRSLVNKHVQYNNAGGQFGFGGKGGYAGAPGLAPGQRNGQKGNAGMDGVNGRPGGKGTLNFEIN